MLLHLNDYVFTIKPQGGDAAQIKASFADPASIVDLTIEQIAECLISGKTIEPGVCPFSDRSKAANAKGTKEEDFAEQTLFMIDIDNVKKGFPEETPEHVVEVLAAHRLKAAFMYESFNSSAGNRRFRFALVASEKFTDKDERDRVHQGLFRMFPQADTTCGNADRMFFGTNKGLLSEFTDFDAVCEKKDLLAIAEKQKTGHQDFQCIETAHRESFNALIPVGQRHRTLVSAAAGILKRYGNCAKAHELFLERVAQCEGVMHDAETDRIWNDAVEYYELNISSDLGYIMPAEYEIQEAGERLEPKDYTDLGQANAFFQLFGNRIRYTPATGFLVFDGTVWNEDETKAQGLSQELTDMQLREARKRLREAQRVMSEAAESGSDAQETIAKIQFKANEQFRDYVLKRRSSDKIKATLIEAKPMVAMSVDDLDKDPFILNTPGGTVELRTGEIRPHDPRDFCTKITAVAPDTENAEIFQAFLKRVTVDNKDLERYLQEVAGMCAVGRVGLETLIIAYGEGGNGKSTLFNVLGRVLGTYTGALSSETLTTTCRTNKSPEYAELRGKRFVIAAELEEGAWLSAASVKKLCSTDPIFAEKKYKAPFSFLPSHSIVLYTNFLPKVSSSDKGTWDRLTVVPFTANFRGMEGEIKNFAEYLFENCGGAILTWIIEGAKRFLANGADIVIPDCVKEITSQYREDNDWFADFLDDCCELDRSYTEKAGNICSSYCGYAARNGAPQKSRKDISHALDSHGFSSHKTSEGRIVYGLRLVRDQNGFDPFS